MRGETFDEISRGRRLVAIVGPTASGKTSLSVALAARHNGEIVNADSRQVYRGMEVGTVTPTAAERAGVPHHLFSIIEPDEPFSLSTYLDLARAALSAIWQRGGVPFLVGGTGQYVWALLEGWEPPRVPPQSELRAQLEARARSEGGDVLYRELAERDPEAARRIDPRNVRRVIRALELLSVGQGAARPQRRAPLFKALILGIRWERAELYRRIDQRVYAMLDSGFVEEVRRLLDAGYSPDLPSLSSLGYREIAAYLRGEMTLDAAIERLKFSSHRLARMQSTWFRADDPRIHWIDGRDDVLRTADRLVSNFLASSD